MFTERAAEITLQSRSRCDGVFLFTYPTFESPKDRITGFFDSGHHPAVMALLTTMSGIFRGGAIAPFTGTATLTVPRQHLPEFTCVGVWMKVLSEVDKGELLRRRW